jgi:phage terminase large subunit-like protein
MVSTKSLSVGLLGGQAQPRVRFAPASKLNAWEDVADLSASLGVPLDDWQEQVFEAAMGERADGKWASRLVGISTPRQNGKSQLIVARALAGVLLFNEQTIICSAHQTDTAREVFQRLLDVIDDNPSVSKRVDSVMKALGREFIRFKGGQTIRIKARSVSGSRGFSSDCLLLDEAQILGRPAWSSILPTMSARDNPQAWLLGTPPTPQDDGEVFEQFREQGIAGTGRRIAYLEWSAEPTDSFDDPEVWAKANPAFGKRIQAEAIEAERSAMSDEQFGMERLGIWHAESSSRVIDEQAWARVADASSMPVDRLTLAIDVPPDRGMVAVSLAGRRADGRWHVELGEHRRGVDWVVPWIAKFAERNRLHAVVADELSGLVEKRRDRHYLVGSDVVVTLAAAEGRDMAIASAKFYDAVMDESLRHTDQPQVNVALSVARKRSLGAGWAWNRKDPTSDITPVVSATLALWGAQNDNVNRPSRRSGGRTAVIL